MTTFKQFILYVYIFFMLFATCNRIFAEKVIVHTKNALAFVFADLSNPKSKVADGFPVENINLNVTGK